MRTMRITMLLLAAAAAMAIGCNRDSAVESSSGGAPETPLPIPQAEPPVADVPMPIGFSLDEGRSRNYSVAGVRFVDHAYKGRGDKFVLKRFYEKYMQVYHWTETTFVFAQESVVLDFEKGTERCKITISGGNWLTGTTVSVLIWPYRTQG